MKKIFLIIFLLPAITGNAQVKNPRFYSLTVENGLSKRSVTAALQDKYGYIWAGTGAGLVRYDGYHAKTYLTNLGTGFLSAVTKIYQDHEGELWVGTRYKGLFQYNRAADTFTQRVYFPADTGANNIGSIQADGQGNIWAISYSATTSFLNCFNKKTGKWQRFSNSDSGSHHINAIRFYSLAEDHKGRVWMTADNGVYAYDNAANQFKGYMILEKPFWYSLLGLPVFYEFPSEPGILYINYWIYRGTSNSRVIGYEKGIARFNENAGNFKKYQIKSEKRTGLGIYTPLEDKKNRLWFGTDNGLVLFNKNTETFERFPMTYNYRNSTYSPYFFHLLEDESGNLWFSSAWSGLYNFNAKEKTFTQYPANTGDPQAFQSTQVIGMFKDNTGTPWFAELNGGLQWLNRKASLFGVYPAKGVQENEYTYGKANVYAEDTAGNIWMGTSKGLVYWNRHNSSFTQIKITYPDLFNMGHNISCIITDKKGRVWYGDKVYGLYCYDPRTGKFRKYLSDSRNSFIGNVSCIYENHDGNILVGTDRAGLFNIILYSGKVIHFPFIRDDGSFAFRNPDEKKLSSDEVMAIFEDRQHTLWIGTSRGLNRFNPKDSTFTTFIDFQKGFTRIRTINEDKKGSLWIGTWEGGLFHFNPQTNAIQQYSEKQGLLINAVYNCIEDSSGIFWLTSPRGITRFDPATGAVHPLTTANGLPPVRIDYGGFKTKEGDFLVSTSNGFIEFNPDQFTPDTDAPVMHIETISFIKPEKGNKLSKDSSVVVFERSKLNLSYDENRITFHYVGIHYQNAAMTQYAYKLEGYDKNWIQAGTDRSVTYTNLSPGTYTFRVKAANSDGVWSGEDSLVVAITPPWWQTWWAYIVYAALLVACVWGFVNYRSRNLKRKNQLLEKKVTQRTSELKQSLEDLKSTQKQLIQSEKMASLGELTAGIAHEIQNPLNFVNNFSDVNKELLAEMKDEILSDNKEEAISIANDVIENEQKINHHGKRADAIVKGMLQHSRSSSGVKEPTDINALCDEYLRLSYHGLRAKDKSFNATMKTDFDENIGKINVVPQDIGRVLLNIINNAFFAVNERKKNLQGFQNLEGLRNGEGLTAAYVPTVTLVTRKTDNNITISIKDNGPGIPQKVVDKIFQPFFTTKPTGSGTGLGLSLAYDIVKAHGGELKVETREGEFTEFIIQLPG